MSHRRPATVADRHVSELLKAHPQLARVTGPCFSFSQEAIEARSVEVNGRISDAERAWRISNDPTYLLCEDVSLWANWQSSRHVYRFDKALTSELLKTSFPDSMPVGMLRRLPYPCLFVEARMPMSMSDGSVAMTSGFFAWTDRTIRAEALAFEDGAECVSIMQLVDGQPRSVMSINLDVDTLGEVISEAMEFDLAEARRVNGSRDAYVTFARDYERMLREHYNQVLSHLLYVVADNSDQEVEYRPSGKSRRKGRCESTIHAVGRRVGRAIGAAKVRYVGEGGTEGDRTVRPHVRAAHWHHYWTGPRSEPEKRELVLRWVMPTFVNGGTDAVTVTHEASRK